MTQKRFDKMTYKVISETEAFLDAFKTFHTVNVISIPGRVESAYKPVERKALKAAKALERFVAAASEIVRQDRATLRTLRRRVKA